MRCEVPARSVQRKQEPHLGCWKNIPSELPSEPRGPRTKNPEQGLPVALESLGRPLPGSPRLLLLLLTFLRPALAGSRGRGPSARLFLYATFAKHSSTRNGPPEEDLAARAIPTTHNVGPPEAAFPSEVTFSSPNFALRAARSARRGYLRALARPP